LYLFATWQRWPADKIVRRKGEGEIDFVVGFAWEQRKNVLVCDIGG
jgi:hypothetical protein